MHVCDGFSQRRVETVEEDSVSQPNVTPRGSRLSFIPCSGFFVCSCWSGFAAHTHSNHLDEIKKKREDEKAKSLRPLIHD